MSNLGLGAQWRVWLLKKRLLKPTAPWLGEGVEGGLSPGSADPAPRAPLPTACFLQPHPSSHPGSGLGGGTPVSLPMAGVGGVGWG